MRSAACQFALKILCRSINLMSPWPRSQSLSHCNRKGDAGSLNGFTGNFAFC
jgi:hypothetical protein